MRVTGGSLKGRIIPSPKNNVRPTQSKIRQAVFNMIGNDLSGFRWVDMFAGSGIMGIEAISRNIDTAVFIDIDRRNLEQIKADLTQMPIPSEKYQITKRSALDMVGEFTKENDIIYLDPPFGFKRMDELIYGMEENFRGILIWELPVDNGSRFQYSISNKRYGKVSIIVARKDEK